MDQKISEPEKRVTDYLGRLIKKGRIPGIQYIVLQGDEVLYQFAGGIRDGANKQPVLPTTTFLSSSSSKTLTAAGVLLLVERGQIALDDSLSKYIPEQPYGDKLKIRHLLNQSSGVPNPLPLSWLHTSTEHSTYSEKSALQTALKENGELDFEPGEKYAYSNLSFWLLGQVIERAAGQSYCEFMRAQVFAPLDITPGELDCEIADKNNFARGHQETCTFLNLFFRLMTEKKIWDESVTLGGKRWSRFQVLYMNGPAYGGLNGTATGYAKFLQDMIRKNPKLFSSATRDLFFSTQKDDRGRLLPTTPGWHRGNLNGITYYGKPGGGPGYSSNIRVYPEQRIATVFLSNQTRVSEGPIHAFSDTLDREFLAAK